jgi:hypothetical protein
MKLLQRFLLLSACVLAMPTAHAATLETLTGQAVTTNPLEFDLATFERDSIVVVDGVTNNIVDVFVPEKFAAALEYRVYSTFLSHTSSFGLTHVDTLSLSRCVSLLSRREVSDKVGVAQCPGKEAWSASNNFASLRWMARMSAIMPAVLGLETNATGGALKFAFANKNYTLRFSFSSTELERRTADLNAMLAEDKREAAEAARAEEERRQLKLEETRRRIEAERPVFEAKLRRVVTQAVMLDGVVALPVKSVAAVTGWFTETQGTCIQVSKSSWFTIAFAEDETVCHESPWQTTNFVPMKVRNQLYAPLPVLNALFKGTQFRHDVSARTLVVRLTHEESVQTTSVLELASRIPAFRTVTGARIYPFTQNSIPKCSSIAVRRAGYTLNITSGKAGYFDHLNVVLSNLSNSPVLVVWSETILRLPNGSRSGVLRGATAFENRDLPQLPSPVAPRSTFSEDLYALKNVEAVTFPYGLETQYSTSLFGISFQVDEVRNSVVVSGSTATVSGVVALRVGTNKVYERFSITCVAKPGEYRR